MTEKIMIEKGKGVKFGASKERLCGVSSISGLVDADEQEWLAPFELENAEETKGGFALSYKNSKKGMAAVSKIQIIGDVFSQNMRITSEKTHTLIRAAVNVDGVCFDENGINKRLSDSSILVHYCISRWQGEGQWRAATPEDLGVYTATGHYWERSWCRFDSVSSWSSATYYPLLIIEDKQKNECWFFEYEGGSSWVIELYGIGGDKIKSLSVRIGGADERLGFAKQLQQNDSYQSENSVYGVVQGGFEEAVRALTKYKRLTSLVKSGSPLVFNDYMNCNWAEESEKRLLPLIDKAAEIGAEVFCIDDGWQEAQGIWYPADEKFGDYKLQGIFDHIAAKGMMIGVWFEFETVPLRVAQMIGASDCFLFRNGAMVAPDRPLANMRSEKLVAYLNERVDALYRMGVRYIKNDHNNTEAIGTTMYGESAAEGLENNARAFLAFIDGLTKRYPDLIIENCASGAMRSNHGTLRHFNIESTSDQENYVAYTSILTGSLALMPPEKAGIWCYPYPLGFDDREELEIAADKLEDFADGEQTIFNVVNGFMGAMYLSGKIHQADEYNLALLKEGIALYKEWREFIKNACPIFPRGMIRLSDRTYNVVGLVDEERGKGLLAVWNLSDKGQEVCVDLEKYGMASCELLYPKGKGGVFYQYDGKKLCCTFENGRCARLFSFTHKK